MAQKRMFDKRITDSDRFMDLPNSSKALYFMAGMSADDRGFFQPRRLQKMCGFTDDDFKVLIAKKYLIPFESGVMVITDWNKNNYLDKNRITETEYIDELHLLRLINEKYELDNACLTNVKPMFNQYSIEENSIEENSIDEGTKKGTKCLIDNNVSKMDTTSIQKKSYGEFKNVLLTDEEYHKLEESNLLPYIEKLSSYIASKGKKYKNHYATILNWNRADKKDDYGSKKVGVVPDWLGKDIKKGEFSEETERLCREVFGNNKE